MNLSVKPTRVTFDPGIMSVSLADGRVLSIPLAWFPHLAHASLEELAQVEISSRGLHWEALHEDISVRGLFLEHGDESRTFTAVNV